MKNRKSSLCQKINNQWCLICQTFSCQLPYRDIAWTAPEIARKSSRPSDSSSCSPCSRATQPRTSCPWVVCNWSVYYQTKYKKTHPNSFESTFFSPPVIECPIACPTDDPTDTSAAVKAVWVNNPNSKSGFLLVDDERVEPPLLSLH